MGKLMHRVVSFTRSGGCRPGTPWGGGEVVVVVASPGEDNGTRGKKEYQEGGQPPRVSFPHRTIKHIGSHAIMNLLI